MIGHETLISCMVCVRSCWANISSVYVKYFPNKCNVCATKSTRLLTPMRTGWPHVCRKFAASPFFNPINCRTCYKNCFTPNDHEGNFLISMECLRNVTTWKMEYSYKYCLDISLHYTAVLCGIGIAGLVLGLRPANERRRYFVTTSLIGWAQT